jgi:hypothetical protein
MGNMKTDKIKTSTIKKSAEKTKQKNLITITIKQFYELQIL